MIDQQEPAYVLMSRSPKKYWKEYDHYPNANSARCALNILKMEHPITDWAVMQMIDYAPAF